MSSWPPLPAASGTVRDGRARGARRAAEGLTWERELDRLDLSYREVCEAAANGSHAGAAEPGNQQETVVPTPRSLSA